MSLWERVKGAFGGGPSERERFAEAVKKIAAHIPGVQRVETGSDELTLEIYSDGQAEPHSLYLGNIWQEMRHETHEERVAHAERFVLDVYAATREAESGSWPQVRERLIPVVRGASSFVVGDRRLSSLRRSFLPFLSEAVVVDSDDSMRYVNEGDPGRWQVSADEVFAQARRNLESLQDNIERCDGPSGARLWRVATHDVYATSRLLLPGWLARFRNRVAGAPVATIPERGVLIVGGSDDATGLKHMLARAEEIALASPRHLSTALYTIDDAGLVQPFDVGDEHPVAPALRHGQHLFAGTEYKLQKEHLEAVHARDQVDVFVASYGVIRQVADGVERSWASWAEGVDTLLPKTDLLALGSTPDGTDAGWMVLVPWSAIQELAADCLEADPTCDPVRYRTRGWPSAAAIAELRRRFERRTS